MYLPPTGDYIGEFTRKLKPGEHVVEFAAADPKNYAYKTIDGKVECKIRGFTLNTRRQAQLNFDLLKANVMDKVTVPLDESEVIPVHNPHKIRRNADTKTLKTVKETKRYRVVFDKYVVDPDTFQSYSYRYTRAEFEDVNMQSIDMLVDCN